jgi:hypothetical protein
MDEHETSAHILRKIKTLLQEDDLIDRVDEDTLGADLTIYANDHCFVLNLDEC